MDRRGGATELYDARVDRGDRRDLAREAPAAVARMLREVDRGQARIQATAHPQPVRRAEPGEGFDERLRGLGYIE